MAVLLDPTDDREFALRGPRHLIGRAPDCDVRVADPLASARHALITRAEGQFFIEDLGSRNGTRVNGEPVRGTTPLHPGDRVQVGGHVLVFQEQRPAPATADDAAGMAAVVGSVEMAAGVRTEVSPEAKLRAVLELSRNLSSTLKLDEVLPRILESLFILFPQAERGFVLLREPVTGRLVPRAVRHRRGEETGAAISQTILDHVAQAGRAVLVADATQDDRFDASQSVRLHQLRSVLCVPLLGRAGDCLGVIQLDAAGRGRAFTPEDLDVLAVATLQAARALELAKLHQELRELDAATQIQRSFLPAEPPTAPGLTFFDHYASAGQVGGDYYDYVRLAGDRLAVAVGDVAGKGVTAALLMARLSATAKFCLATEPTPAAAVRQINAGVTRPGRDGRFVTLVLGVIDLGTFAMTVVNAGHMPPLRRCPDGTLEEVGSAAAGIPLGVFDRPYQEAVVPVEPGDLFVLYTDGLTEARNPDGEMYGSERLRAVVRRTAGDAAQAGPAILADVRAFAAGRPLADDLTLVCFSRTG